MKRSGSPSNTWFLEPTQAKTQMASRLVQPFWYKSPQSIPILYNGPPFYPLKITPCYGRTWTLSNTWFLTLTQAHNPNGISITSDVFTDNADYFTMGCPFPPQNCPFQRGESGPHLILDPILEPTRAQNLKGISIGSAIFAAIFCDRQTVRPTTDHTTRSVTIGHFYICDTAMQPKNRTSIFRQN